MVALPTMKEPLPRCVTAEEYLAFEENSAVRTEYLNGRVYCKGMPIDPASITEDELWAMAGAMPEHDRALINFIIVVGSQLWGKSCRLHSTDQRVELTGTQQYVYPDITGSCGTPVYDMTLKPPVLKNPILVVEILSPSTRRYDLSDKAEAYRQHPTIQDFLFISPDKVFVLHYARQNVINWIATEYNELTQTVRLNSLDCDVSLTEIYHEVFD